MFKLIVSLSLVALALAVPFNSQARRFQQGRIIGGEEADIAEVPYQVALLFYTYHMCGGSIVNENTVITAAHCTDGYYAYQLHVKVGSSEIHDKEGALLDVDYFIQHPLYDDDRTDYDISILKLSTSISFNSKASPIALQEANVGVAAGTVATISGWGVVADGEEDTPEHLRKVDVNIITIQECKSYFNSEDKITARMICAKADGKDSCQGDSGGPLVANNKLVGVVSWGEGCADPNYPGVYANVANLRRWLDENM